MGNKFARSVAIQIVKAKQLSQKLKFWESLAIKKTRVGQSTGQNILEKGKLVNGLPFFN
jgi:hypothetical protein